MRHFSPMRNGCSASFPVVHRTKRSLAIDLKTAEGLAIVHKADRDGGRAGAQLPSRGLPSAWASAKTRCADTTRYVLRVDQQGSETSGPYASQRAYDPCIQALSGLRKFQPIETTAPADGAHYHRGQYHGLDCAAQRSRRAVRAERSGKASTCGSRCWTQMIAYLWPEAMPSLPSWGGT